MGIISCGTTLIDQGLYQGLTSVDWDTTPKTATFTGVAGNGYFCNTSSGTFTLNLPAGSVGDIIAVSDYASTFNVAETPAVYSNPESSLGTPDFTINSVNNFSSGTGTTPNATVRAQDLYSAVDVGSFTSSDYGVLWENGGTGQGFAASLEAGGQLWVAAYNGGSWQASGQAYLKVDVSSYYNTPGTFYTTIDHTAKQFNLYFQPGGPTGGNQAISLGTSTAGTASTWSGSAGGALGQLNSGMVNFGFTNYSATFTGDAQELRWYYNTAEPSPFQSITTPAVSAKYLTISPNGTDKINGTNEDYLATTKGVSLVLLYVDSTRGWKVVGGGEIDAAGGSYITATGGTITTDGDFKIHTFTGPGTFTVCEVGSNPSFNVVDYLVIAGGGGGKHGAGAEAGGGGGAGGYRESSGCATCFSASPSGSGVSALPISVTGYPITVGGGGDIGVNGSNSIFSTITSAGGGHATLPGVNSCLGNPGGSGGGARAGGSPKAGGTGNTPPVTPPQGNDGGNAVHESGGSGGGGAGAVGYSTNTCTRFPGIPSPNSSGPGGNGGCGQTSSITGSPGGRAGGGGGGSKNSPAPSIGFGKDGGGDGGGPPGCVSSTAGTANTGGGGGGGTQSQTPPATVGNGSAGGSGIVIIRYKYQ